MRLEYLILYSELVASMSSELYLYPMAYTDSSQIHKLIIVYFFICYIYIDIYR